MDSTINLNAKKFITVHDNVILYELNGIQGPILNPVWMSIDMIEKMINKSRHIREHDAKNPQRYVILDRDNYDDLNIYPGNIEIIEPEYSENTYILTVADDKGDKNMNPGKLYVSILE